MAKKAKEPQKPSLAWQGTYGDMITLMLCFFVMLYNPSEVDTTQLATITQSLEMTETETTSGGMSLSAGMLSDLGNNINSLPSTEKGRSLGNAKKKRGITKQLYRAFGVHLSLYSARMDALYSLMRFSSPS